MANKGDKPLHKTTIVLWSTKPLRPGPLQSMLDAAPPEAIRAIQSGTERVTTPNEDPEWGEENEVLMGGAEPEEDEPVDDDEDDGELPPDEDEDDDADGPSDDDLDALEGIPDPDDDD